MAHRRRRRSAPSRPREGLVVAIAIEKDLPERGRSSVEGGRTRVDWLTPHLTPYPRRRLGSDLQNSGLFFSSALVRKNAACLSSSPAARHRSPPPTAHRPSTAPAAQSIGWRTHRAGKRRSTQTADVRGLSTLKLAKTKPLIASVTSSPPPLVSKVGSHLHRRAALVGGSEHAAGGRRSRELGGWRAQVGDDRSI